MKPQKGTVVFFEPFKGFGKIRCENGNVVLVGLADLRDQIYPGNRVCFVLDESGTKALKVTLEKAN